MAGYEGMLPATSHAARNTMARSFMHRQLWLNDPDCLMLRRSATEMSPEAMEGWARLVGVSGGMALVSDDLSLLDHTSRRLLDEVISLGIEADAAARHGKPPRCPDLMDQRDGGTHDAPRLLVAAGHRLTLDPATGASSIETE